MVHEKCRGQFYANSSDVRRFQMDDDEQVFYEIDYSSYAPTAYESEVLQTAEWADTAAVDSLKFNVLDQNIDRRSFEGIYRLDGETGRPLNVKGRTGVVGRGILGKWGPNHAADPIVTKWARNEDGGIVVNEESGKPVLMFIAIKRDDNGQWALPGGMVDPGENITDALKREFGEEAMNTDAHPDRAAAIDQIFHSGHLIYQGYVDDPRNTDNAWMETQAVNFHVEKDQLDKLESGSDATSVEWTTLDSKLNLYASHARFLELTAAHHQAHW